MANKIGTRLPPRTSVRLLQMFFELLDNDERSYGVIAKRIGITKQTLSYWRHGHRSPSAQTLEDAFFVLGYRLDKVPLEKE